MDINTDWRIRNQMNYLKGVRLVHSKYIQPREDWDHDHCEFCTDKIDVSTGMAYYTKDTHYWICEECYADFKELFEWKLE